LIISNDKSQVTGWLNKEDLPSKESVGSYYKNQVNSGIHILSLDFIKSCPQFKEKIDLDRDMLKPSIPSGQIFVYQTPEYIKDMGTPERYAQVTADIKNGIVQKKNLRVKQKAIFLDRDGTINTLNGFIKSPEDFNLIDGVAEAIRIINSLGYLTIVITNQPVIARGEIDFETLDLIHKKMETDLGKHGAYIDDLFFCPHHQDKGFPGERSEYKIDCDCRKPKPGMLFRAAKKYNIDLAQSFMVGDDKRDIQAGINAGCTPVFLSDNRNYEDDSVKTFNNLQNFVDWLCVHE
jgi:D-glycero-D-manno-heptose 1,7-bisphosphate phosphatase